MPGFDKTGPNGQGAMTGRRMGRCTNFGAGARNQAPEADINTNENSPNDFQPGNFGWGRGGGRGFGRGCGRGFGRGFARGAQNGNAQV